MARVRITPVRDGDAAAFRCPGCDDEHVIPVTGPRAWTFNGTLDQPTLSPSILVRWREWNADGSETNHACHSFVRDGRIEFLGDCTHALAGQTVDLSEI